VDLVLLLKFHDDQMIKTWHNENIRSMHAGSSGWHETFGCGKQGIVDLCEDSHGKAPS
jgi:hypothetical protein